MNVILFGAPGAGKGTQSEMMIKSLGMTQISTGDLFRSAIKNKTELGVEAQSYMDKGQLVPDSVTVAMVEEVLKGGVKNFILDGFPRTIEQAEALEVLLTKYSITVSKAIFLEVPKVVLLKRLTGRRVCKNCSTVYHLDVKPTKTPGVCDTCGGEVVLRSDDRDEVIENRLKTYDEYTSPLKDYFVKTGKFVAIDGNRSAGIIHKDILDLIG